jgi:hypothetical protein
MTEGTMLRNRRARAKDGHALQRDVTAADVRETLLHPTPPGFQTLHWGGALCTMQTIVDGPALLPSALYSVYANEPTNQLPQPPKLRRRIYFCH